MFLVDRRIITIARKRLAFTSNHQVTLRKVAQYNDGVEYKYLSMYHGLAVDVS